MAFCYSSEWEASFELLQLTGFKGIIQVPATLDQSQIDQNLPTPHNVRYCTHHAVRCVPYCHSNARTTYATRSYGGLF